MKNSQIKHDKNLTLSFTKGTAIVFVLAFVLIFVVILLYFRMSLQQDNKKGECSFWSATYVVAGQVKDQKIQIFATRSNPHYKKLNFQNLEVQVVYSEGIIKNNFPLAGSYNQLHNLLIMRYACDEYIKGDKTIGKKIISLLADVAPDTSVSTEGKSISIKTLKSMIDTNNSKALKVIQRNAEQWDFTKKDAIINN
jgi:hypothetical protein